MHAKRFVMLILTLLLGLSFIACDNFENDELLGDADPDESASPDGDADAIIDGDVDAEPEPDTEPEIDGDADPEPDIEPELEPELEPEPDVDPEPEPDWEDELAVMTKGPYVQGATDRSITIRWETDRFASTRVEISRPMAAPIRRVTGHAFRIEHDPELEILPLLLPEEWQHSVTIDGLTPGVEYSYRIVSLAEPSRRYRFRLRPENEPYTLVAYGDSRTHHDQHLQVAKAIASEHPDLVLQTGDLISLGLNPYDWTSLFEIIDVFAPECTLIPAIGNHDGSGVTAFMGYFNEIFEHDVTHAGSDVYRFRDVWILILNSELSFDAGSLTRSYAERMLDEAKDDAGIRFRFVMFHKPFYTWSSHRPDEIADPESREQLHALFSDHKVNIVLTGHNHCYERFERDGVQYLTLGGGGAGLYDPDRYPDAAEEQYRVIGLKRHHYMVAKPGPRGEALEARVIGVPTIGVEGQMVGEELDAFELPAR